MKTPKPRITEFSLHALSLAVSKARAAARTAANAARESQSLADASYCAARVAFTAAEKVFSDYGCKEDAK